MNKKQHEIKTLIRQLSRTRSQIDTMISILTKELNEGENNER